MTLKSNLCLVYIMLKIVDSLKKSQQGFRCLLSRPQPNGPPLVNEGDLQPHMGDVCSWWMEDPWHQNILQIIIVIDAGHHDDDLPIPG